MKPKIKAGEPYDWDHRKEITINLNIVSMPDREGLLENMEVDGKPVNQMYLKSSIATVVSNSSPRTRGNLDSVNENVHNLDNFKVKIRPTVTGFNEFFKILHTKMIEKKIDAMFIPPYPLGFLCFDNAGFGAEFGTPDYWRQGAQKDMGKELMVCANPLYSPMSYMEYIHPEGDYKMNIWEEETWQEMLEAAENDSRGLHPEQDSPEISLTLYITTKLELFDRIYGLKYWSKSDPESAWKGYKSPEVAEKMGLQVSERLLGIHQQTVAQDPEYLQLVLKSARTPKKKKKKRSSKKKKRSRRKKKKRSSKKNKNKKTKKKIT